MGQRELCRCADSRPHSELGLQPVRLQNCPQDGARAHEPQRLWAPLTAVHAGDLGLIQSRSAALGASLIPFDYLGWQK